MELPSRTETTSPTALRFAAYAGRPLAAPSPVDPEQLELARLERQERSARSDYLRQRQLAGPYAQPVSVFRHVVGPDGRGYLREVELKFDLLTAGEDSEETVEKAEAVRRAALAANFPDQSDLMLAAKASLMLALARARQVVAAESDSEPEPSSSGSTPVYTGGAGETFSAQA